MCIRDSRAAVAVRARLGARARGAALAAVRVVHRRVDAVRSAARSLTAVGGAVSAMRLVVRRVEATARARRRPRVAGALDGAHAGDALPRSAAGQSAVERRAARVSALAAVAD